MLPLFWAHDVAGAPGVWTVLLLGLAFVMLFALVKIIGASGRA